MKQKLKNMALTCSAFCMLLSICGCNATPQPIDAKDTGAYDIGNILKLIDICDINEASRLLQLTAINDGNINNNEKIYQSKFMKASYSLVKKPNEIEAVLSIFFEESTSCIKEAQLTTAYGKGLYMPTIDRTNSDDEIRNPSKYAHQIYFPRVRGKISINGLVSAQQCVKRLTIEQHNCNRKE